VIETPNLNKILVVDDNPDNLQMLASILERRGYEVQVATGGKKALKAAEVNPPDLILLDINMPDMDGYEVCKYFKEHQALSDVPVIFISGLNNPDEIVKGFEVGGVDYVTKPFYLFEVQARIETHLAIRRYQIQLQQYNQNLQNLVRQQVKEISSSQMATIRALAMLAESRDYDVGKHIERTQTFCRMIANKLKENPRFNGTINDQYIDNIYHAAPLHDIGKVGIKDSILHNPAVLTDDEYDIMKMHTTIGAKTLEAVRAEYPRNNFINMGIAIARYHHEKWDGTGYPDGLAGEDIPLSARIMAVADVYDALRSKRYYKKPFTHEESRKIILEQRGKHFDPVLVDLFEEMESKFDRIHRAVNSD
jgi:putative two-component system response regulator